MFSESTIVVAAAPLRRSPKWGLFFVAFGILMIPASYIAINSVGLSANELKIKALHEMQRTDLKVEEEIYWYEIARKAEMIEKTEESHQQHKNTVFQFLVLPLAGSLILIGRRLRADEAYKLIDRDQRPAILYLRSFSADTPGYSSFIPRTNEEKLVKLLRRAGPVIAIGKPSEHLPRLGAARLYVPEHRWQVVVGQLIEQSGLVVWLEETRQDFTGRCGICATEPRLEKFSFTILLWGTVSNLRSYASTYTKPFMLPYLMNVRQ